MRWLLIFASLLFGTLAIVWMVVPEFSLSLLGPDLLFGKGRWGTIDGKLAVFSPDALGHAFFVRLIGCGLASLFACGLLIWSFRCHDTTTEPST